MSGRPPRVLAIAGTDPTGGAGIQADIKTISALGGYAMAAITAVVAQNTTGVRAVRPVSARLLAAQLDAVSDDVEIDAVKIGMLGSSSAARTVAAWLGRARPPIVVLDPVMRATTGGRLTSRRALGSVRELIRRVDLVTPNRDELALLLGRTPADEWQRAVDDAVEAATLWGTRVLLTGGDGAGDLAVDVLVEPRANGGARLTEASAPRVATHHTHGTGCALSSALATLQAVENDWARSVARAKQWLVGTLRDAEMLEVGRGAGPLHHFHRLSADTAPQRSVSADDER